MLATLKKNILYNALLDSYFLISKTTSTSTPVDSKKKKGTLKKKKNFTVFHNFVECKVTLLKEIAKHCH